VFARISASQFRFKIYHFDGSDYFEIPQNRLTPDYHLFKPMGTLKPGSNYVASDADYVDYITELMGGFAIPDFLKEYRKGKQYLFIGMPLNRDSERNGDERYCLRSGRPQRLGFEQNPTDKEQRFCKKWDWKFLTQGLKSCCGCLMTWIVVQ